MPAEVPLVAAPPPIEESRRARDLRRRYEVPATVRLLADEREILAFLPGYEVAVRAVASRGDALPRADVGGRAALRRVEADEGPVLARPYRKGGMLRLVRGGRFHGALRPLRELVLLRRLQALGIPVVEAVGAVVHTGPLGWRGWLLTREVEGAVDLEAWLHGGRATQEREVLREAGRIVRRLHDAGVAHADLHPKNLLRDPSRRVVLLDLDKAFDGGGTLSDERRLENLVRLGRAVEKHRLKGLRAGRREALRFLEGYAGDRAAAAEWLERVAARLRRGLRWRMIWWRLTGEARPWRPRAPAAG
jgi:tRNA A-37 threonylcarbamoyl transferase component Bud32